MGTVTIGADTVEVYGTSAGLASYANTSLTWSAVYTAAVAESADKPKRALREATVLLDRQSWTGAKTGGSGQAMAWPRTDCIDVDGNEVDSSTVPASIEQGAYELALAALADPSIIEATSTGSRIRTAYAKGSGVEYFSPDEGARFPDRVMELIGWAFGGGADAGGGDHLPAGAGPGAFVGGTCAESAFDDCDRYRLSEAS